MNSPRNQPLSSRRRGSVLIIGVIVLFLLIAIGTVSLMRSRQNSASSGNQRKVTDLKNAALDGLDVVGTNLTHWWDDNPDPNPPFVFVKNPLTSPYTYWRQDLGDSPKYTFIALDPSALGGNVLLKLVQDYVTELNTASNYPITTSGWTNPDPNHTGYQPGVFRKIDYGNGLSVNIWAEPQSVNSADGSCTTGGVWGVACVETVKTQGVDQPAAKIILNATSTQTDLSTNSIIRTMRLKRTFWLIPVQNQSFKYSILAARINECSSCHAKSFGDVGQTGKHDFGAISYHYMQTIFYGNLLTAGKISVDHHPYDPTPRVVDCNAPSNAPFCVVDPLYGQRLIYNKCGDTTNPACLNTQGSDFNGMLDVRGVREEQVNDPTKLPSALPTLLDYDNIDDPLHPSNGQPFCPSWDTSCSDPTKYFANYDGTGLPNTSGKGPTKLRSYYESAVQTDYAYSFIKIKPDAGGSYGNAKIYFSPGRSDIPANQLFDITDKTIAPGNVLIPADGMYAGSPAVQIPASGNFIDGNLIIKSDDNNPLIVCGQNAIRGGDLVLSGTISNVNECSGPYSGGHGKGTLMTQGNNYILGSVTYADAGPFNAPPSGPPGSNYTMAEFTTPTDQLVLRAGGSTIASDLHNSGVIDFAAWLNHESSATKPDTAANLTGTDNMLQHGVYETYPGKNFTLGFYPSDGSRVAGNNPNVFINKMTSPGTDFGSTGGFLLGDGSTVPPNNTVPKVAISGILPAGAVYAYDRTNYDPADPAHDQTFQGGWIDSNYLSAIFHNGTAPHATSNVPDDVSLTHVILPATTSDGAFFSFNRSNGMGEEGGFYWGVYPKVPWDQSPGQSQDWDNDAAGPDGMRFNQTIANDFQIFAPGGNFAFTDPRLAQSTNALIFPPGRIVETSEIQTVSNP